MDSARFQGRRLVQWSAAAAAVAAMAVGSFWWLHGSGGGNESDKGPVAVMASDSCPVEGSLVVEPASSGSYSVVAGQTIETTDSEVAISDPRIGTVRLSPRTRIRIGSWNNDSALLYLDMGTITAAVDHRDPGQTFEVRTEFASVEVVGTMFEVEHAPTSLTTITCIRGRIHIDTFTGLEVAAMEAGKILKVGPLIAVGPSPVGVDVAMATVPGDRNAGRIAVRPSRAWKRKAPDNQPEAVREEAVQIETESLPTAGELIARARRLLADGKNAEAIACLKGFKGTEGRPSVLALLGDAWQLEGGLDRARGAYEEALSAGPSPAPEGVMVDLARLYQDKLGEPGKARASWERYIQSYPRGRYAGLALYRLAGLAGDAGRITDSDDLLRRVVRQAPGSSWAVRALSDVGVALSREGRADDAAAWFAEFRDSRAADLAEAALVGLMRVRERQRDAKAVQILAAEYSRRFPDGKWKDSIGDLLK